MAANCITKGADVFKCAISVAPVTDWRYYDNIYTERFMQTPALNKDGYTNTSCLKYTDKYKGKLLLMHGSGDDNVHVQNSMELINAMVKYNKQFDYFVYPNRAHGISGGYSRLHLYQKMTDFIFTNL
jgi:dipeptidyl-peptidase-4